MSEVAHIFEEEGNSMSLLWDTTPRTLDPQNAAPRLTRALDVRLVPGGPRLWRVLDRRAIVIGHLQAVSRDADTRYRALRFHAPSRAFRDLGEFWSPDDAVECIVFAR